MSHHYTLSGSVSYGEYTIDIYHSSVADAIDMGLVETLMEHSVQNLQPRMLTATLIAASNDILKIDIKDNQNNIVLTTEIDPHIE